MPPQLRGALLDDLMRAAESAGFQRDAAAHLASSWRRLEWVAAEKEVQLDEAIAAQLGLEAVAEIGREAATLSLQGSLLQPIAESALRFFGPRPYALFRWAPSFWGVATRGVGLLRIEELEHGARVTIHDVPPEVGSSRPWRAEIRGRLLSGIDVVGVDGDVVEEPSSSAIVFRVHWSA